jgi:hypothetical protein
MRGGLLYPVAVMDRFTRFVLSWQLSNIMETGSAGSLVPPRPTREL